MVPQKSDNPHLPISVEEIVADVKRCRDAGASIVHLHARDKDGSASYQEEVYRELFTRVRSECPDILISASTSGRAFKEFSQRAQSLIADPLIKPDFGSLTLGSFNFPTQASINEPEMIKALAARMSALGIVPEWECFELGMIDFAKFLIEKEILLRPFYCNILLGSLGTLSASPHNLINMVNQLPAGTTWSATGVGRYQFSVNCLAISMGGHVRVGLEDSLWYDEKKSKLATNAGLIERIAKVANSMAREIASPQEARQIIGLPERNKLAKLALGTASNTGL